jgi:AraC-like DNA-binding protein
MENSKRRAYDNGKLLAETTTAYRMLLAQKILQLKADGFTLKEISAKVGYQNHSAVSKRIHHISEKYAEYRNQ